MLNSPDAQQQKAIFMPEDPLTPNKPLDPSPGTSNERWLQNVKPLNWVNPTPNGRYNLVVVGAGTGGLVAAAGAAGLGAKVALVERNMMGGDCLNAGCVPSKALLAVAKKLGHVRAASQQPWAKWDSVDFDVDFAAIMQRMRALRASISQHDSVQRFTDLGVDVFLGDGKFLSRHQLSVGDQVLNFRKAVVATGSCANRIDLPGEVCVPILTNETLFELEQLPRRLLVIGGGPIGCEMAQAFARFGSEVTVLEKGDRILKRDDADAAKWVAESMKSDGVQFFFNASIQRFEKSGVPNAGPSQSRSHQQWVVFDCDGQPQRIACDAILLALGRTPNVRGLGLEAADIEIDREGKLALDRYYRTSNRNIFAVGDVVGSWQFTHAADFMARGVIQNALFFGGKKLSSLVVPRCTYTFPELASVGLTAASAQEQEIQVQTHRIPFSSIDRAILDGETAGWAEVCLADGTDRILGATVVGNDAGDLISQFSLAMTQRIGLRKFAATIFPYPTRAEIVRKLGDQYNRGRLTPWIASLFQRWLKWSR